MTLCIKKSGEDCFEPFVPPTESFSGFEKFKVQEFILGLNSGKCVWNTNEIINESRQQGFKEATIKRAISNLVQSGKLIKLRHGEYEINE